MAPRNDTPPTSTTNVILGVTLSFGIVALVLGLYFIYKAYMRYLKHQQHNNLQPHRRSQNRTSARTLPQDKHPDSWQRKPGNDSLRHRKRTTVDMRETGRDYRNGDATNPPKETRDSSRGRRIDRGQRTESIHGKRVRGIPPASRPQRAYRERQNGRAQSVGPPPFSGGPYQAVFRSNGQDPDQGQWPTRHRNFDAFRNSYPTQLPGVAVPRGQDTFGQGWTRDTIPHEWRPRSANRTTAAMPPMSMPQPREAAHLHPNFPKQRLGTPLNPTSEVSHLISALDTESLHDSRNQRVEHTNDGARSFQSVEDRHDNRSSTSEKGGSDEGSGHGSWSGRSSGISSLGERSHHQALPQDSAGADANYGNEVKRGDGDTPGSHGATQGVDMTEGHQGPDKANNEAWSGREDFSARA